MPPRSDPSLHSLDHCGTREDLPEPSSLEEEVVSLFDRFRDRMLRYLLTLGLTLCDGEEIVQEVFLSLFRHLELGKPRDNLDGWLFRVAHNLGLKRREQIRKSQVIGSDASFPEDCITDPSPTPEERIVQRQLQQRLRSVVQTLPEQDGRCLALRAEGLRYRQIAQALDMSLGAVSLSLARSLARLSRAAAR